MKNRNNNFSKTLKCNDCIFVKGAREHNLKNIDVNIPRTSLTVITGLSGSGKSSLAFDTIYAEGQRRYVESLSAYARQFLGLMEKPDVDYIEGLSPAISIEQRKGSHNPRSTVGTVTEIYDYLRLLFARLGTPHCPLCGKEISQQTPHEIVDTVMSMPEDTRIQVLSPLVRGRKGEYRELFKRIQSDGYLRVRVDSEIKILDEPITLDKNIKHTIEVVVDRLVVSNKIRTRLADSVETALKLSDGLVVVSTLSGEERLFSEHFACHDCNISIEEIEPRLFSFNSPFGACSACSGLGTQMEIDPEKVIPDDSLSILEGAIKPWGIPRGHWYYMQIFSVADHYGEDLTKPYRKLTKKFQNVVLYGTGTTSIRFRYKSSNGRAKGEYTGPFEGIIPNLKRRYRQTESQQIRSWIENFMRTIPCHECGGARLRKEALAVTFKSMNIYEMTQLSVGEAFQYFTSVALTEREALIAHQILKEIRQRLRFMQNVGLDYLTLNRITGSLSGGEAQRIRLATQIGSQLVGVLYILDEPSIGLHQRDNERLLDTLLALRDLGNTVLVVEHDRETIKHADYIIDLGPGAGVHGGQVVATGTPEKIAQSQSLTGLYLSGKEKIEIPSKLRSGNGKFLSIKGATGNNLKSLSVDIPLGKFICVTGVSGSGKSTLINLTLFPALARKLMKANVDPLPYKAISGQNFVDKVISIDQSPIGRTPRSNPATYTGLFTPLRELYSKLPEAKVRGYKPGRFSFNVKGGRCERCQGAGIIKIEMHFLPDVYVPCEECKGRRYNRETLDIRFKGLTIADVLNLTCDEALEIFENIPVIKRKLQTLKDVGLGYIHIGQQATTLSGGEAQRIKLASELSRVSTGRTLYILDEPTTGLHFEDVKMLLSVLSRLIDAGNTVIVIEHNMDVIKSADYIIDLGPEGGDCGGKVVATGSPAEVAKMPQSYTGQFLMKELLSVE
ncbi:MAG TPA: excinuclease ABC subunit UvrA [Anaerolineae bacterium]|nr:excinuclease ABC subunit UvrA [Anaerolineae bacterium]